MKRFFLFFLAAFPVMLHAQKGPVAIEPGISFNLATYRQSIISNLQYTLSFNIPAAKKEKIAATEKIDLDLSSTSQPLQLDFSQPADHITGVMVNGKPAPVVLQQEHFIIDPALLRKGPNSIALVFTAGDPSLNRNEDYLYALFVPDHAHTVFPCFDQPDLKARFLLTLEVPAGWKVLANGVTKDSVVRGDRVTFHFTNSDKLSTYLFSFTAGRYSATTRPAGQRKATFLYRETDTAKLRLSVDSIFRIHRNAISFLEHYTGIPFPFQKVGFVAIPDFQFGGMEHPGEVQYKASSLFLDEGATREMGIGRISLISHETAHMWFGDRVTMRWFNDVWMKEVFANFMADKVTEDLMGTETFNLKFLQDHYPAAYGIDRTQGAHPIRQQLDNLRDAGSMYGNIIYHKAPIMMRQLELLMGKEPFRKGLSEYLNTYAYGNATWPDLISILNRHSKVDLYNWNKVWVNEPGRPVFDYQVQYNEGKIARLTITQQAEMGSPRSWPQLFNVAFVYAGHIRMLPVHMDGQTLELTEAKGAPRPLSILFNADGIGYGLFPADTAGAEALYGLKSPLQRASAYVNLYENMLAGRSVKPADMLQLFSTGLSAEQNEMNLRLLTGYVGNIYWGFLSQEKRNGLAAVVEEAVWKAMEGQPDASNKKVLFKLYQDVFTGAGAQERMYRIWQQQQPPAGVKLTEDDYTSLALSLALRSDTSQVLQQQDNRIKNEDRKKRLEFLMPALSPDTAVRDRFFSSLQDRKNREKESWVVSALSYLHHPLRQAVSVKYIPQSLELLEQIQRTGDIFFPQSWLGATLGLYQNPAAARMVQDFLQAHPDYNPKLKNKLLQSADNLFRAQKLVE